MTLGKAFNLFVFWFPQQQSRDNKSPCLVAVLCGLNRKGSVHSTGPATELALRNYGLSLVVCMDLGQGNIFPITNPLTAGLSSSLIPKSALPSLRKNENVLRQTLKLMPNSN